MILEEITIEEVHLVEMLTRAKQDEEKFNVITWSQGFGLYGVNIGWGAFTYHYSMWDKAIRHFGLHIHPTKEKSYKEGLKEAIKEIVNTKDYEESFLNCLHKMKARNKKKYKECYYTENYIREEIEQYEI